MKYVHLKHLRLLCLLAVLGLHVPLSARAQDEKQSGEGARDPGALTIEIDKDGGVTINGYRMESDGKPFRVEADSGSYTFYYKNNDGDHVFRRFFGPGEFAFDGEDLAERLDPGGRLRDELLPKVRSFRFDGSGDPDVLIPRFEFDAREMSEVAPLEREARELARQIRDANENERRNLERDLRTKLETIFDKKMEIRKQRVERLEGDLKEQQRRLEERLQARDEMIDRRYKELLGLDNDLDW